MASTKGRAAFTMRRDTAPRDRATVFVLLDTGLQAAELCDLKVGISTLPRAERVIVQKGKGGKYSYNRPPIVSWGRDETLAVFRSIFAMSF